jgi:hypothetical protein
MPIRFEMFHGLGKPWPELCKEASEFANQIGRERLISISQSEDQDEPLSRCGTGKRSRALPRLPAQNKRKPTAEPGRRNERLLGIRQK